MQCIIHQRLNDSKVFYPLGFSCNLINVILRLCNADISGEECAAQVNELSLRV